LLLLCAVLLHHAADLVVHLLKDLFERVVSKCCYQLYWRHSLLWSHI